MGSYMHMCKENGSIYNIDNSCKLTIIPYAKEEIWERYCHYNRMYKEHYMTAHEPNARIDRHKIAAGYTASIASVRPLRLWIKNTGKSQDKEQMPEMVPSNIMVNEMLAITVGMSVLTSICTSKYVDDIPSNEKGRMAAGILFPVIGDGRNADNYHISLAKELHYSVLDGNLNLLSLSNQMYLLEVISRNGLDEVSKG